MERDTPSISRVLLIDEGVKKGFPPRPLVGELSLVRRDTRTVCQGLAAASMHSQ